MKIHEYNEMMAHLTRRRSMSNGGFIKREKFANGSKLDNETFIELYKNFTGTDQEFANFLDEQGYVLRGGKKPTADSVEMRRARLGIKSKSPIKFYLSDKEILKEAKRLKVDTKNLSKEEIRRLTLQRRGDEVRKKRLQTDPEFVEYRRNIARKVAEDIKKDPVRLARKKEMTAARQSKRIFGLVPTEKTPKGLLYRDLIENALRYQDNKLPTSHIQFLNPKNTRPKSIPETLKTKLIDTNVLDKKGKPKVITYDNVLKHIDDNKKLYGTDSKSTLKEYEKKRFIQENPDLRDKFNKKLNKTYDPTSATKRNVFSPFHIHHTAGRGQNAFNVQFATASDNMKENALRRVFDTDFKVAKNLSDKKKVIKKYLDAVPETLEVRLKNTPYGTRETLVDMTKRVAPDVFEEQPRAMKELMKRAGANLDPALAVKAAGEEITRSPAARNLFSSAGKIALGELGFAGPSVVLDTYAGLTPSEMALNVATFGFGTPIKDSVQKRKYIADAGFGSDYSSALQKRKNLKTAPEDAVGQLTEKEKQAIFLANAFDAGLDLQRAERAADYQQRQQNQLKRGELEIPDYTDVPEATTSIQPEFQEETTETRSLPFGLDRLLPFDDEDEIIW